MNKIIGFLRRQPPGRLIALGFAAVILLGSVLLIMALQRAGGRGGAVY